MDDDDDGSGILNIQFSDDEDDQKRADRTGQTEAAFQAVKQEYRAKVENGEASEASLHFKRQTLTPYRSSRPLSCQLTRAPASSIFKRSSTPLKNSTSSGDIERRWAFWRPCTATEVPRHSTTIPARF